MEECPFGGRLQLGEELRNRGIGFSEAHFVRIFVGGEIDGENLGCPA